MDIHRDVSLLRTCHLWHPYAAFHFTHQVCVYCPSIVALHAVLRPSLNLRYVFEYISVLLVSLRLNN